MTRLRNALIRFDPAEVAVRIPQESSIRLAPRNGESFGSRFETDALSAPVVPALESGEPLSHELWRISPWHLWRGTPAIAERPRAFERFVLFMETEARAETIRDLATVYLVQFEPSRPRVLEISDLLVRIVHRGGGHHASLQERFSLFALPEGPKRLGAACLAAEQPALAETLRDLGFDSRERHGGIAELVHADGFAAFRLRHLQNRDENSLDTLVDWGEDADGGLLFPETAPALADAVVAPFAEDPHPPALKTALLVPVLRHLGVPRHDSPVWRRTTPATRRAVGRWLAARSLANFFEIVDDTAHRDHWEHRRAFWKAYDDAGRIDEAWVAFGPRGARRARQTLGTDGEFAELVRSSRKVIEPGHAVLMIRIENVTITDWSHRGACHIWGPDDGLPPLLYQPRYSADDVMRPDRGASARVVYHMDSAEYGWQRRVAGIIQELTGIEMPETAYHVPE